MILFRSTHEAVVAGHQTALQVAREHLAEIRENLIEARREIRALTRTIISMKAEGKVVDPGAMEERWGRYVIPDEDEEHPTEPRVTVPDDAAELEADLLRSLDEGFPHD